MDAILKFFGMAVSRGTSLLFGTTGEILTEKSGHLNLGVEGIMSIGGILGFYFAYLSGSLAVGLLMAFVGGALASLLYAFLTITLKANQNVTGLTLSIFGVAFSKFFGVHWLVVGGKKLQLSERLQALVGSKLFGPLADIPFIGPILFGHDLMVYVAIIVAVAVGLYLKRTRSGLRIRAIGENPGAADAVGINVDRVKYLANVVGGGICGLGGAYVSIFVGMGGWIEGGGMTGQGWISVALVIFANWSSIKALWGSLVFGAFLSLTAYAGNLATEFPKLLTWLKDVPGAFYTMLPYLLTAVILVVTSVRGKKQSGPAALGLNYYREER